MEKRPLVGIGVIIVKNNKVLLGKRKAPHGNGTWCFPGGHLEYKESIEDCARRETMEEAGIKIDNLKLGPYTNDIYPKADTHYITLFVIAEPESGEVKVMEPEKCEQWEWFEWDNMPQPLFFPIQNLLKQNFNPFE